MTVKGTGFFATAEALKCCYGDIMVPGEFISPTNIVCHTPDSLPSGLLFLDVTLNGLLQDRSKSGIQLSVYDTPSINFISPSRVSVDGGTTVYVHGLNFSNVDDGENVRCNFGHEF